MKPVRYAPEARDEFLDALRWYAERSLPATKRFDEYVSKAEAAIREAPHQWPRVTGVATELDVRRRLVEGFPFAVVDVELETVVLILAVAHGKRRPGYWRKRNPRPER